MQCKASRSDDCMDAGGRATQDAKAENPRQFQIDRSEVSEDDYRETCMDALILRVQEAQEQCVEGRAPKVGALGDAETPTGRRW